jgi:hypothetical protein
MNSPQQREPFQDIRTGFNIFSHLVNGYATAIVPFFRKDFGTAFFGLNALVAVLVMMVFGGMENDDTMLRYMFLWFLFVAAHRLDAGRAHRKGRVIHSRYTGDNWLASKLFSKAKHRTVQLLIEPALCLVVGVLICPHSPGIGKFLILGAFAVLVFNGSQRALMEQRVRNMHDAHIEQQATAQMFRGNSDDF